MSDENRTPAKKPKVVRWSTLRIDALQAVSSEAIQAIEDKLATADVSAIDSDVVRELRSVLESISQEIEDARQLNLRSDEAD